MGDTVTVHVDYDRRSYIAPNHTMTHVLNYALRSVLVGAGTLPSCVFGCTNCVACISIQDVWHALQFVQQINSNMILSVLLVRHIYSLTVYSGLPQ